MRLHQHTVPLAALVELRCYVEISILLENTPLIKFVLNYTPDLSGISSISSPVGISIMLFLAFSKLLVQTVSLSIL